MIWWILGIVVTIIILWWLKKPIYYRNVERDEIERFIKGLLDVGADGSLLIIQHEGSPRFIQFAKYIENETKTNLHFGFPDAPWSRESFESLEKKLKSAGIKYKIQLTSDNEYVRKFLNVDNIRDIATAVRIANIAFDVMGLDEKEKFKIHYEGYISRKASKKYFLNQLMKKRKE